ncbi:MAG: ATP synthase F1 subunit gamma [Acidobacteriota bacterium]|nr:ATP synthase F1 subunit gamma [Acidobacteriota bacterium]
MAKTQDLRRRIRSISNTRQLTRAMKTVSAAKLRRAQDRMLAARPYAGKVIGVLQSLAARANPELHPLLQVHGNRRIDMILLTADRGLSGSFNANICRTAQEFLSGLGGRDITVHTIGKKGNEYFKRRGYAIGRSWFDVFRDLDYPLVADIARFFMDRYEKREVDEIYVAYNEFKSAIQQRPVVERVLPIEPAELESGQAEDYLYEPNAKALFDTMIPRYVEVRAFRALLESVAAEHAARMTAMDAATRNAGELIDKLTLHMNRVRQASITTEIIEVVSGAQALG